MVIGLARSGIAAAEFLARRGASVVATDTKSEGELPGEALALRERGVRLELGGHRRETFTGATMVVVSPGVPWELPELEAARAAGVPVIAEIELAFRHLAGPRRRDHRDEGQDDDHRRPRGDAARGRLRRAGGRQHRRAPRGPRRGVDGGHHVRGRGVELPARGHGALPPPRGGLAQPLPRPPRPAPLAGGVRGGQGARLRQPGSRGLGGRERRRPRRPRAGAGGARPQAPLPRHRRAAPVGRRRLLRGGPRPVPARRAPGDALPEGRGGPARGAPRSATSSSRRRRRGSWGPRRRRSRARCGRSAASSTCSSTWPRSAGSRTTTTRRPRTSRPRAAAWRPSPSRS